MNCEIIYPRLRACAQYRYHGVNPQQFPKTQILMAYITVCEKFSDISEVDSMFIGRPFSLRIGLHFELPFDGLTIGRGLENDLALPGSLGNRFHCRIFRQGEQYVLKYFETRQCPVYNGKCQW
ncbi:MAG: FHA domain-containing protein, partial [Pirellula sp.]